MAAARSVLPILVLPLPPGDDFGLGHLIALLGDELRDDRGEKVDERVGKKEEEDSHREES